MSSNAMSSAIYYVKYIIHFRRPSYCPSMAVLVVHTYMYVMCLTPPLLSEKPCMPVTLAVPGQYTV